MKALLDDAGVSRTAKSELRRLLSFPWCQPPEGDTQVRIPADLSYERRSPRPGEVLLVTVGEGDDASIWAFGAGGSTPLLQDARALLERIAWDVLRDFAGWRVPPDIRMPPPEAEWLASSRGQHPDELTGASFGAAFLLSLVSIGLQQSVPGDLVALATLDEAGRLGRVEELELKLRTVSECAPGVRRCIVAACERERAQRSFPALRVLGAGDADELVDLVFSPVPPADVEAQARRLFAVALNPSSRMVSWERFRSEAQKTAALPRLTPWAKWQAQVAWAIAARHLSGQSEAFPKMPAGAPPLPRPIHEKVLCHQVEHLADSGAADDGFVDEIASGLLPARDCSLTQLELRGAVARALARRRDYGEASKLLAETVAVWFEIGRMADAGRPLCEWARVAGIVNDRHALATSIAPYAHRLAIELLATSRHGDFAFLALAMGRAWTQVGALEEASAWWSRGDWSRARTWLCRSRERWQARGQWQSGDRDGALSRLALIVDEPDLAALARIDACLLTGADPAGAVAAFLATDGAHEAAWLLRGARNASESARRLHEESPY